MFCENGEDSEKPIGKEPLIRHFVTPSPHRRRGVLNGFALSSCPISHGGEGALAF